ncbi:MAG: ABC transporter permease [Firmicutes bacterium]|nr:ABC transporter permease [Bacillota bacterium]
MYWYLAKLAYKNLVRQKRRTLVTCLTLSVAILSYIATDGLLAGLDQMAIDNLISYESGHIQVLDPRYLDERDELPLEYTFPVGELPQQISSVEGVEAVTPRITFSALLNNGMDELLVVALGIDPDTDPRVFKLPEHITGEMFEPESYQAVIGESLADLMELTIGDYFTLITKTKTGAFQAIDVQISGLAKTPHPEINLSSVFIPYDVAAKALGMPGQATELFIRIGDGQDVDGVTVAVNQALDASAPVRAYSWREVSADFLAMSESEAQIMGVFLGLILLIGIVGVVNTVLLGAMERVKEIGTMKAMGLQEREIIMEFAFEALGIGVLGSLVGVALGALLNWFLVDVGMDLTYFFGDMSVGYPVTGSIHSVWNPQTMVQSFVMGVLICLVASYLPARAAAVKDPIQSLQAH